MPETGIVTSGGGNDWANTASKRVLEEDESAQQESRASAVYSEGNDQGWSGGEESREVPRTSTVSTGLYLDSITAQQIAAG
jgi:hypothetical protein